MNKPKIIQIIDVVSNAIAGNRIDEDFIKSCLSKFIDLNQIVGCHLLYTTDVKTNKTVKIEFELLYKRINHKEVFTVYDAKFDPMNQVCLFEDEKLAKNWRQKINSLLV